MTMVLPAIYFTFHEDLQGAIQFLNDEVSGGSKDGNSD